MGQSDTLPTSSAATAPWSSEQLQQATQGQWHNLHAQTPASFNRIVTDNRRVQPNDVFLALVGERFDGHNFAADAVANGASAVIVSRVIEQLAVPQLVVPDTRLALGHLGSYRRQQQPDLTVLALTGSSGKTTVKEMLGSILRLSAPTLVTRGNLNNDLGVPMMLLELLPEHRYAVMELGANHVGEIDYTSNLVQPQVAGVLNIGTAHMGEFGGRLGIANAKSEIFKHLKANDTHPAIAIVPAHGDFSDVVQQAASRHKTISFGTGGNVFAENIELQATSSQFELVTPQGRIAISLPFAGQHNIENALAAASFALAIDVPLQQIAQGLESAVGAQGRLTFKKYGNWLVIDDTYNANPHSMRAAAQVLAAQAGRKILVLGDIGELGEAAREEHYSLGQDLASLKLDAVFAVGEFAAQTIDGLQSQNQQMQAQAFTEKPELLLHLRQFLAQAKTSNASLLFKGSRYTRMESLIADLIDGLPAGAIAG
ncbi:UDP-N-acetylmuramoyl-tripeptide--D-alanyl-D-alanine ligase [Alkanindiges illinoisensis]|uniref:UDP-N-acetylmuramoyl-tripeptide--D-alanyl-D-alanine ligase n=1 Tax=Alkanindiges illinoisensis TaxID=197183 RepID=A0A4Y7XDP1_9GAMM|nr:UDP-N-acetylmuramoyl-tripeptide--D-alanyl-D-alanine ligase [Alkanindiges illinoisensis]TEU27937.1 UDP-N-acetylmuramoyl-tripeptide--D-alanyl-D-alanine ligase [Alkanindiges illinoisensis]